VEQAELNTYDCTDGAFEWTGSVLMGETQYLNGTTRQLRKVVADGEPKVMVRQTQAGAFVSGFGFNSTLSS